MLNQTRAHPPQTCDRPALSTAEQEAELVARAKADRNAFAPLYSRYLDPVYRYCYRRLGSREAAEDATAEVFYKALAALPGYRDGSFGGWLMTIAHNVVTDCFRRQRPEQPLDPTYDRPADAATPEEQAVAADERRFLRMLLTRLPADQRSVMELRLAGLEGTEIATVLGRSLGAVKMLQFRAIEQLRVLMAVRTRSGEAYHGKV